MEELEPRYEIPHRTVIPRIYGEVKEQVNSKIVDLQQQKNKVALITDMWTSEEMRGIKLSLFNTRVWAGVCESCCWAFFWMAHRCKYSFGYILSDNAIEQSTVSAIIADNASNMDLALWIGEWRNRHCFSHALQLAINDGLKMSPGVQRHDKICQNHCSIFHRSTKATKKLKELQVQLKLTWLQDYQTAQHSGIVPTICSKGSWSKKLPSQWCVVQLEVHEQASKFQNGPCWRNLCKY